MNALDYVSESFEYEKSSVKNVIELNEDGNTIPFIARYRKEMTKGLNEEDIRLIIKEYEYFNKLCKLRSDIKVKLEEAGKFRSEIGEALDKCKTIKELEEIYKPFKRKKETKGEIARKNGLLPLLDIFKSVKNGNKDDIINKFIYDKKIDFTKEEAYSGALDIFAEDISLDSDLKLRITRVTLVKGFLKIKLKKDISEEMRGKYLNYSDGIFQISRVKSYQVLAIIRGKKEEALSYKIDFKIEEIFKREVHRYVSGDLLFAKDLENGFKDSLRRLVLPSVERNIIDQLKKISQEKSIGIFQKNLRSVLLTKPLKNKIILALDPGFRTGCKLTIISENGELLDYGVIYPTKPREDFEGSRKKIEDYINKYGVGIIAIGNATASRETEEFISKVLEKYPEVKYTIVSEGGASIYSASKKAREEMGDLDLTYRSSASIGRRLLDPLGELVKVPPRSIGVGQYQYDIKESVLDIALEDTVYDCVNLKGVDLNTASLEILKYISGLNKSVGKNILEYRKKIGSYKNRKDLLKVKGLGENTFKQCVGFLRIYDGDCIFDSTGIHPESYHLVDKIMGGETFFSEDLKETVRDVKRELNLIGKEEECFQPVAFRESVRNFADLKIDDEVSGIVRNVVEFGAFVDIGVGVDALLHISEISETYIDNTLEHLNAGQNIRVRIKEIDKNRMRIGVSKKGMRI